MVIGTGPKPITIQIQGKAEEIEEYDDIADVLEALRRKVDEKSLTHWPMEEIKRFKGHRAVVFKVVPTKVLMTNLSETDYPHTLGNDQIRVFPWTDNYVHN